MAIYTKEAENPVVAHSKREHWRTPGEGLVSSLGWKPREAGSKTDEGGQQEDS